MKCIDFIYKGYRHLSVVFGICAVIGLSFFSCAPSLMATVPKMEKPDPDHAVITFIRSSIMAPTQEAELWDREKPIGELKPRSFIQYKAAPGKHLFLAKSEQWSFLEANLITGEHYVVKLEVVPGNYAARLEFSPLSPKDGKTEQSDIDECLSSLKGRSLKKDMAGEYAQLRLSEVKKAIKDHDEGHTTFEILEPEDFWPISH
jgi:hypothetical protein